VFFVTANDTTTNHTYFLAYKGNVDTNSALMYMTKLDNDSHSYERVTATHNHNTDKTFTFVLSDTKISAWEVYSTPVMTVTPNISLLDMTRGQKAE